MLNKIAIRFAFATLVMAFIVIVYVAYPVGFPGRVRTVSTETQQFEVRGEVLQSPEAPELDSTTTQKSSNQSTGTFTSTTNTTSTSNTSSGSSQEKADCRIVSLGLLKNIMACI